MSYEVWDLKCRGCGAPIQVGMKECPYGHPVNISTFNSVYSMPMPMVNKYVNSYKTDLNNVPDDKELNKSVGLCFLKLKMYQNAQSAFDKVVADNFNDSESYFYAAVSYLGGKKAFLNTRMNIDKSLEYINAARMIEPRGIFTYFEAYIKYDYFYRKSYRVVPDYIECLKKANELGTSELDIQMMYDMLNVSKPEAL